MTDFALPVAITQPAPYEEPAPHTPPHADLLLTGLGLATGMEFYTFDSINLVLPDLTGALGVSADEASWILTVYSSSLFLGVPVSIWLAGHVGNRGFLIATVVLFAVASMGCAASADLPTMLCWRAVQGFAGAGLVVWWRAGICLLFPRPRRSPSLMRVSDVRIFDWFGDELEAKRLPGPQPTDIDCNDLVRGFLKSIRQCRPHGTSLSIPR